MYYILWRTQAMTATQLTVDGPSRGGKDRTGCFFRCPNKKVPKQRSSANILRKWGFSPVFFGFHQQKNWVFEQEKLGLEQQEHFDLLKFIDIYCSQTSQIGMNHDLNTRNWQHDSWDRKAPYIGKRWRTHDFLRFFFESILETWGFFSHFRYPSQLTSILSPVLRVIQNRTIAVIRGIWVCLFK